MAARVDGVEQTAIYPDMKLRDHRLMTRKSGFCSWPPLWYSRRWNKEDDKPQGEVGILEDVVANDLIDNKLFLYVTFEGYQIMGVMGFDDATFCRHLFEILKLNRGLSIEQIGDLDLSHLL